MVLSSPLLMIEQMIGAVACRLKCTDGHYPGRLKEVTNEIIDKLVSIFQNP